MSTADNIRYNTSTPFNVNNSAAFHTPAQSHLISTPGQQLSDNFYFKIRYTAAVILLIQDTQGDRSNQIRVSLLFPFLPSCLTSLIHRFCSNPILFSSKISRNIASSWGGGLPNIKILGSCPISLSAVC